MKTVDRIAISIGFIVIVTMLGLSNEIQKQRHSEAMHNDSVIIANQVMIMWPEMSDSAQKVYVQKKMKEKN